MTDHAAVVQSLAVGVAGAVLTLLGVDAQQLTVAFIACTLGALFAPIVARWKALALFASAVAATAVAASELGPVMAAWWPGMSPQAGAKLVALGVGIWLHPVIQVGATLVPRLAEWGMSKIGARTDGGTQ